MHVNHLTQAVLEGRHWEVPMNTQPGDIEYDENDSKERLIQVANRLKMLVIAEGYLNHAEALEKASTSLEKLAKKDIFEIQLAYTIAESFQGVHAHAERALLPSITPQDNVYTHLRAHTEKLQTWVKEGAIPTELWFETKMTLAHALSTLEESKLEAFSHLNPLIDAITENSPYYLTVKIYEIWFYALNDRIDISLNYLKHHEDLLKQNKPTDQNSHPIQRFYFYFLYAEVHHKAVQQFETLQQALQSVGADKTKLANHGYYASLQATECLKHLIDQVDANYNYLTKWSPRLLQIKADLHQYATPNLESILTEDIQKH